MNTDRYDDSALIQMARENFFPFLDGVRNSGQILTNRVDDLTKRLETIEASDVIREAELREELGYLSIDFRKRGKNYNCDD